MLEDNLTIGSTGRVTISVRSDDADIAETVRAIFSCPVPNQKSPHNGPVQHMYEIVRRSGEADDASYVVTRDGEHQFSARSIPQLMNWVESSITDRLSRALEDYWLIHSGEVARNGHVVLVPGASGAGNSTTVSMLSIGGFEYLSDEVAVAHEDLRAFPFPKVASLKDGGRRVIRSWFPDEMARGVVYEPPESGVTYFRPERSPGPDAARSGYPIDFVVLPRRDPSMESCLQPTKKTDALRVMVEESLDLELRGAEGFDRLVETVKAADCYSLNVNDPERAIELMMDLTS